MLYFFFGYFVTYLLTFLLDFVSSVYFFLFSLFVV